MAHVTFLEFYACWHFGTMISIALISFLLFSLMLFKEIKHDVNGCDKQKPLCEQDFFLLSLFLNNDRFNTIPENTQALTKEKQGWIMNDIYVVFFFIFTFQRVNFRWRIRLINSLALFSSNFPGSHAIFVFISAKELYMCVCIGHTNFE